MSSLSWVQSDAEKGFGSSKNYPCEFSPLPQDASEPDSDSNPLEADEPKRLGPKDFFFGFLLVMLTLPNLLIITHMLSTPPGGPMLNPDTFSVSNFSISDSKLAATWNADFAFRSSLHHHEYDYSSVTGTIYFKDIKALNVLSVASAKPFVLGFKERKTVHMKFATIGEEIEQQKIEYSALDELSKDRETGTARFSLKVDVRYKSKVWGTYFPNVLPYTDHYCWNLVVRFEADTGNGRLIDGGHKYCPFSPW
ncbi:PREDICTED: uncharacterized protein LOC18608203 [Theobroma cacao]|uniref:Uncharacterized protein LOC18608203 n=1 Tax=Theobroma cacao TaxID=3641 RepID=A0AB32VHS1_THECC|nr:PREDICTED: uncharacterized protein LOC18608203 [Theobroma cacao]